MRKLFFILFLIPSAGNAQDYVDLLKIGYGQTFNNNFTETSGSTEVKFLEADLTLPIVINNKNAFITGASFSHNNLQLFPDSPYSSLYSTTLKLGLASAFDEKWSSTLVLLPKIASDYKNISGDDFYMGGFALLKLKKKENLIYRMGVYATSEAFGFFTTPILGWYYLSPNKKFEMDMSLPIAADINYNIGFATIGMDYFGIGRSFKLHDENDGNYVDLSSLEFAGYVQFKTFQKSVLLRLKSGYASSDYEVYAVEDKIDLGVSAFSFGDSRLLLNPEIAGGIFIKFEAIYRFDIPKSQQK